jgi:hypothetical protein
VALFAADSAPQNVVAGACYLLIYRTCAWYDAENNVGTDPRRTPWPLGSRSVVSQPSLVGSRTVAPRPEPVDRACCRIDPKAVMRDMGAQASLQAP